VPGESRPRGRTGVSSSVTREGIGDARANPGANPASGGELAETRLPQLEVRSIGATDMPARGNPGGGEARVGSVPSIRLSAPHLQAALAGSIRAHRIPRRGTSKGATGISFVGHARLSTALRGAMHADHRSACARRASELRTSCGHDPWSGPARVHLHSRGIHAHARLATSRRARSPLLPSSSLSSA